ncbi:MAG: TIGR01620 family protein [Rhodobacteraceae bacterium]|nr:TIGR01620 family protein [Paracoccaceae bacterium]
MTEKHSRQPVLIDLETTTEDRQQPTPAEAPPVPDPELPERNSAMEVALRVSARKPSLLLRVFVGGLATLIGFMLSVAVWDFATEILSRNIWLGRFALALVALTAGALLLVALRELAAISRLRRVDTLRSEADALLQEGTLEKARAYCRKLSLFYARREDLRWGFAELDMRLAEQMDPDAVLVLAESNLLAPLDKQATNQIETASRQVATATAIIPLAFVDVIVALTANIRMIRRIAEIYGGRSGTFGSWRLTKAVAAHLVATGAVAIGDDLIGSVAGGGVLSKVSRRFGEGVVNGALTARVGIAAMEVCRPMPFVAEPRPRVTQLVRRALTGLFSKEKG